VGGGGVKDVSRVACSKEVKEGEGLR